MQNIEPTALPRQGAARTRMLFAGVALALASLAGLGQAQDHGSRDAGRTRPAADALPRTPFAREVLDAASAGAGVLSTPRSLPGAEPAGPAPALDPAAAADLSGSAASALSPPLDEVLQATDADGNLWVRGRTYKASFGPDGATYVPFLGSGAPRNYPLRMRVAGATVGGRPLALGAPQARRTSDRIVIERGPLRAEYVPSLTAIEQLFVLDEAPSDAGDLVVTLDVDTDLAPRALASGHAFEGPSGGVRYGEAFVLDASGSRLATPAVVEQDRIRIRVPHSFVAGATYPLAIDPLISTDTIDGSAADQRHPDVAWDPVSNVFYVAYHEVFSASDFDIKLVKTNIDGATLGSPFYADFSSVHARLPRIAVNRHDRRALVVYTTGADGTRRIEGNVIDLTSTAGLGPRITISSNPEALDLARPDVAGDAFDGPDAWFTVVWERIWDEDDKDIVLRQVTPDGILLPEQLVTNFVGIRDEAPSISTAPSDQGIHNLVWRRDGNQVVGAQYDFGGYLATPPFVMFAYDPTLSLSVPSVSALGPNVPGTTARAYAVTASLYLPASNQSEVLLFTFAGNQLVDSAQNTYLEHVDFFADQRRPTVASSGEGFAVAYEGGPSIGAVHRTYVTTFNLANRSLAVAERRVLADSSSAWHYDPRICSLWESGEDGFGYEYGPFSVVSEAGGDIVYGSLQSFPVSGAQHEFCYGFENSTGERSLLTISGSADDTSSTRVLRVSDLPTNKPGIFFTSRSAASPGFVPGGSAGRLCLFNPIGRFPVIVNSGSSGTAALTIDPSGLPQAGGLVAAAPGETWYFQYWHRDTDGGPTSNFSNATAIPFH